MRTRLVTQIRIEKRKVNSITHTVNSLKTLNWNTKKKKKDTTYLNRCFPCFSPERLFFKDLFIFLREREREKERNISVWLPLTSPHTGNLTSDPLLHRPALKTRSHINHDRFFFIYIEPHIQKFVTCMLSWPLFSKAHTAPPSSLPK